MSNARIRKKRWKIFMKKFTSSKRMKLVVDLLSSKNPILDDWTIQEQKDES